MHELFEKSLKKVYMNVNRIIIDLSAIIPESHFEPGKNKKFVFSALEKKGRSENYLPAIQWLCDFGIINLCYNLTSISDPLEGNKIDTVFKIYMQDSGLFIVCFYNRCTEHLKTVGQLQC